MRVTGCEETDVVDDNQQRREASTSLQGRVLAVGAHRERVPWITWEATGGRCY